MVRSSSKDRLGHRWVWQSSLSQLEEGQNDKQRRTEAIEEKTCTLQCSKEGRETNVEG